MQSITARHRTRIRRAKETQAVDYSWFSFSFCIPFVNHFCSRIFHLFPVGPNLFSFITNVKATESGDFTFHFVFSRLRFQNALRLFYSSSDLDQRPRRTFDLPLRQDRKRASLKQILRELSARFQVHLAYSSFIFIISAYFCANNTIELKMKWNLTGFFRSHTRTTYIKSLAASKIV